MKVGSRTHDLFQAPKLWGGLLRAADDWWSQLRFRSCSPLGLLVPGAGRPPHPSLPHGARLWGGDAATTGDREPLPWLSLERGPWGLAEGSGCIGFLIAGRQTVLTLRGAFLFLL